MVSASELRASTQLNSLCRSLHLPSPGSSSTFPETPARIISCDLEKHCLAPQDVTAIGLSVLHTDEIRLDDPGVNGVNWIPNIQSFNIRPRETGHQANNFSFFTDKPEDFQFGHDEWILKADTPKLFKDVLEDFPREIVLICHDTRGDIKDIRDKLGFDVQASSKKITILDSQIMAKARGYQNQIGLKALTGSLGISGIAFHNGGNDAAVTLINSILMAICHSEEYVSAAALTTFDNDVMSEAQPVSGGLLPPPNSFSGSNTSSASDPTLSTLPASITSEQGHTYSVQEVVVMLMSKAYRVDPLFGSFYHCTRCNGMDHLGVACYGPVNCYRCHGKGHATELCMCPEKHLQQRIQNNIARFGDVRSRQSLLR